MIAGIHSSQEIFAIDMLTALKPSVEHDDIASMLCNCYDYMKTRLNLKVKSRIKTSPALPLFLFAYSHRLFKKRPAKLMQRVKIAHSCLRSVSHQFCHFIIVILPM